MTDSIDQLLAQMKGKYNPQDNPQNPSQPQPDSGLPDLLSPTQPKQPSHSAPSPVANSSIDELLNAIDPQNQPTAVPSQKPIVPIQPSKNPKFDALLHPPQPKPQTTPNPKLDAILPSEQQAIGKDGMDHLLTDLKAIYTGQDQAIEQAQQQEREAEQRRQTALQRQQSAKIKRQAQTWLDQLDAESTEAAWFEEFAAKYESRVAAAIDFLGLK